MHGDATTILVVDDEPYIGMLISRWLTADGYECTTATSGDQALEELEKNSYELVISDIMMPGMSGIELLSEVKSRWPDVAMVMATAVDDRQTGVRTLQIGAYGYIIKPLAHNDVLINVANALERRRLTLLSQDYERELERKIELRTTQLREAQEEIIHRLISASGFRDEETGAHVRRIGLYSGVVARVLGWGERRANDIKLAAPMHDVGKIGIPDRILRKAGRLTREEYEIMKKHTLIGARILEGSNVPLLELARDIALTHHEKWDGSGYPQGLAGEGIPEEGRIVGVVDVYDALVHKRVYKEAFPEDKAIAIMCEAKGSHFDPHMLDAFLRVLPEMRRIREDVRDEETDAALCAELSAC
ncbi:MAG: HD domain-containing phosphohydrolase [Thermodesulfobacteriota bacterium]